MRRPLLYRTAGVTTAAAIVLSTAVSVGTGVEDFIAPAPALASAAADPADLLASADPSEPAPLPTLSPTVVGVATTATTATTGVAGVGAAGVSLPASVSPSEATASAAPTVSAASAASARQLAQRIRATLGPQAGNVAVVVHDRRTGVVISHNPAMRNRTGSIVKVMILTALIHERRLAGRTLTSGEWATARRMITVSDNDAATTLLARAGGRASLDRLAARLGMSSTASDRAWGRTITTAGDQVKLIDALVDGRAVHNRTDRTRVLNLMASVSRDQAWGVGALPSSARVQLKNGWVPLSPYGWRVNSIGHVSGPGRDYSIAMLSLRSSWPGGTRVLNRVSRVVWNGIVDVRGRSATQTAPTVSVSRHALARRPLAHPKTAQTVVAGRRVTKSDTSFRAHPL